MILRIEDTDAERNKPELVEGILDGLQWLGVDWDEGPFYQSQRTDLYRAAAKKLPRQRQCLSVLLRRRKIRGRRSRRRRRRGTQSAPHVALHLPRRQALHSRRETRDSFQVPVGGITKFYDAVFGEREFSNDEIEDFVLLRSGKGPARAGEADENSACPPIS